MTETKCEHEWVEKRCMTDMVLVCSKCGIDKWAWSQKDDEWEEKFFRDDWANGSWEES